MTSVIISNSNNELFYIMHYTCLKDVFQKLVIDNGSSGFNFHDDVIDRMITIGLKVFFHFSMTAIALSIGITAIDSYPEYWVWMNPLRSMKIRISDQAPRQALGLIEL